MSCPDCIDSGPTRGLAPEDAEITIQNGRQQLDAGFFPARWGRAIMDERVYMRAMALDGDEWSSTTAAADRQGVEIGSLGPTRAQFISEGLFHSSGYGKVVSTVPGTPGFISGQHEEWP